MKITNPSRHAELARDKVKMVMSAVGVETFLVIFRDPDTDTICSATKGDLLWSIGALEAKKQDLVKEYLGKVAVG